MNIGQANAVMALLHWLIGDTTRTDDQAAAALTLLTVAAGNRLQLPQHPDNALRAVTKVAQMRADLARLQTLPERPSGGGTRLLCPRCGCWWPVSEADPDATLTDVYEHILSTHANEATAVALLLLAEVREEPL